MFHAISSDLFSLFKIYMNNNEAVVKLPVKLDNYI